MCGQGLREPQEWTRVGERAVTMVSGVTLNQARALTRLFPTLRNATIPPLDPWLTANQQSVVVELVFWCIAYAVYANFFSLLLRVTLSEYPFWDKAKKRSGTFAQSKL